MERILREILGIVSRLEQKPLLLESNGFREKVKREIEENIPF
jgi:hypothetical protein